MTIHTASTCPLCAIRQTTAPEFVTTAPAMPVSLVKANVGPTYRAR